MKTPRLLQISAFCLIVLTTCEKKESMNNAEPISKKFQNRDAALQRQGAVITGRNQDLAKNIRDVQKLLGNGMIHTESDWAKLRASYWPSSWETTFTTDRFKSVRELIKDHNYESLLRKVAKHDLADLANDEEECLSIWFTASLASAYSSADSLPNAFAIRGETPEPTKGDLILYVLFRDAYSNKEGRSHLDTKQNEQWKKMSESPNPVVRLLAAETYLHVEDDLSDWVGFYSAFKKDSDPYVVEKALSALYTSGKADAIGVLGEFDKSEVVRVNPQLRQQVASMILSLQKNAAQEK